LRHVQKRSAKKAATPSDSLPSSAALPARAEAFPVVAIGASAGGLDACRTLLDALPAGAGLALILVQHLDPTHASMLVELLAGHTSMKVCQATDGMPIEPDHLYVIPPGAYLSAGAGVLRLTPPQERHGARLPFDFLLHALAQEFGPRAIAVILSGTGADGSSGLKAIKEQGGLVIAQEPEEAGYDGMPRSAIQTGEVDLVLPAAKIPQAILSPAERARAAVEGRRAPEPDWLARIIELLRTKTTHDFRLYKSGTLQRRIERRMALESDDRDRYLQILRDDPVKLDLLAKDLLINVTQFFRDPKAFDFLAKNVIPVLVADQPAGQPLRIWIAGCSTGEEAYSLAVLFREAIAAAGKNVKLQVFASDIDVDAVAQARDGLYPASIATDVSAARLAGFFVKEERGYRVNPDLRADVVFTVQDVLADPPFSRIDFVSCRNVLIYLSPEAQAKVIAMFHFALREGGVLFLGGAETVGEAHGRFTALSKTDRIYRHAAPSRPGEFDFPAGSGPRAPVRQGPSPSRQTRLAELCQRLVLENYAPAAVLIDRKNECLFSLGPTDRYLTLAPGQPTHDLLAMARKGFASKLRSTIQRAFQDNAPVTADGCRVERDGEPLRFSLSARPVLSDGEELALVCFLDDKTRQERRESRPVAPGEVSRVAELEQELEATRTELQGAIRNLEIAGEEHKAINEEALSVNEEFQSANQELLTSKEELQSLNEELTALNSQLQETLDRQRTTSDDLQNVLYSTDVATIFLDVNLNIRLFTPAARSLFNLIPGDVGRPLADMASFAPYTALLPDARAVLAKHLPIERQIEAGGGSWRLRRILPYRAQDGGVEGVVITFADITERKSVNDALEAARKQAEMADAAKSRFLAAASHDLRQPLQTLALLQGLLTRAVEGERERKMVARIGETLGAMTGMLNALLDINQIEAGVVRAEIELFPVNDLLVKLRDELAYQAQAKSLVLRMVPCSLSIFSDPRILEQMVRNLLANALKYTKSGKILLGCRRHDGKLRIEVWDTGIGIPDAEIQAIFDEYHQIGNEARERSLGLGLGLSIVRRLGNLLGHRVRVRSRHGDGSVFSIEVSLPETATAVKPVDRNQQDDAEGSPRTRRKGAVLVVEDDPQLRELLAQFLNEEGHRVAQVYDGLEAMQRVESEDFRPDAILADFNLPNGMNGLEVAAKVRERLHRDIPVIILTGDISTKTLRAIAGADCAQLNKPVKLEEVTQAIQRALAPKTQRPRAHPPVETVAAPAPPVIFVVDDDNHIRAALRSVLEDDGRTVEDFASCEDFLEAFHPGQQACLLIDAQLPGMSGLELLQRLSNEGRLLPAVMITGNADVAMAVQAMKAGAMDFIEKPIGRDELLACVERALDHSQDESKLTAWREAAASHMAGLTPRQKEVMELVLAGCPSKNIAADLGISQRTVENHRAAIMKRTGAKSLPALARLAVAAAH
jgi:two-component system, chemotaxis family, CheB/CheR fusion protein